MNNELSKQAKQEISNQEGVERLENTRVYLPRADIWEEENLTTLLLDMPGVEEKNIEITLEKNVLKLKGRVKQDEFSGLALIYGEYGTGDYARSFTVGDEIDRNAITAELKDGVLRVTLPRSKPETKKISVTAR